MKALAVALLGWCVAAVHAYWMEEIAHEGYAPFAGDNYTVFRNVKDYGARGDGITDDTAAINRAIADGNRCGMGCNGSTTTPAVVYFPRGTYAVSAPVTPYYLTQLIGDPGAPPTLRATAAFAGLAVVDGNPYAANSSGTPAWLPANVFYRQVRNLVVDTTAVSSGNAEVVGVHWPTAQATSLQNLRFVLGDAGHHTGLVVEAGSGGLLADLAFVGGHTGARLGNQQFTARGLVFSGCRTGLRQVWDWGWTYAQLRFEGCAVGIDMATAHRTVGSLAVVDSAFVDVAVAVRTAARVDGTANGTMAPTAGSVVLENVATANVAAVVQAADGRVLLAGQSGSATVVAWAVGHAYEDGQATNPTPVQGPIAANGRPAALLGAPGAAAAGGYRYYARSKPQYADVPAARVFRARAAGAVGDGVADDTAALQRLLDRAAQEAANEPLVYLDHGLYRVTAPLTVAPGTRIVGEAYPVLLASSTGADADAFGDAARPQPLLRVGAFAGQQGAAAELSDLVLATHGPQPGAVLVQWNLAADGAPGGLWDVHTRVGGFQGSGLQGCRVADGDSACVGAFLALHIPAAAANVYAENVWLWTADHDLDDAAAARLTVRSGRGVLVESARGPVWLVATAAEHHALYQYQLAGTQNVYLGHVQTETPYYQPEKRGGMGIWTTNADYGDPEFACSDGDSDADDTCMAWGLRIVDAARVLVYGAGLYSFFQDYDQACLPSACQASIVSLERARDVRLYTLNTVGVRSMVDVDGAAVAAAAANRNRDTGTIAVFG